MVRYRALIVLALVGLIVGCTTWSNAVAGSGNLITQTEDISGFDRLEIGSAFKVDVSQGESFSVAIRIDDNLRKYLEVAKQGSTLKISLDADRGVTRATLEAEVTMPALTGLDLRGASRATITGFRSSAGLVVDLQGASSLRGDIEAGQAQFRTEGASDVTLSGSAGDVDIDASGGSTVDLGDLTAGDASVEADGASRVTVNASGTLDVDARGAAHVYYLGSPTLGTIKETQGSEVGPK
jgi:hypothetical protein